MLCTGYRSVPLAAAEYCRLCLLLVRPWFGGPNGPCTLSPHSDVRGHRIPMFVAFLTAEINYEHRETSHRVLWLLYSLAYGYWPFVDTFCLHPQGTNETQCPCYPPVPFTKRTICSNPDRHRSTLITNHQFPGTHNSTELELFWEPVDPVTVNRDLHLTEYRLVNLHSNFTVANYTLRAERSNSFSLNSRVYGKFGE
jgi:hypothetical protein